MSEDSDLIHSLVSRLATLAVGAGVRIATAESCTGGMIAARITDLAGSSVWYDRSFITYSNESKTEMLGVPAETIAAHGAVSEETVLAMALGALTASGANLTVAVSGVAGPDGGSVEKPVGTVWIACAGRLEERDIAPQVQHFQFTGDRSAVRLQSVVEALGLLITCVET